jgi:NAD(P)-dependent dehydrogenase (short-subunit alcohol dehydrogenase family)
MKLHLKKIEDQVLVITGASSGIGLVTAKKAAAAGAKVVLAARNDRDLARAVEEIREAGGEAVYEVADVADPREVEWIAETALKSFGRIDTWVNNAGVAMYGRLLDLSLEDMKRQFDTLYWGVVNGCRTAVPRLRTEGGAIINVASVLADFVVPLQGNYCAAKHAVKAFTTTLRMELEAEDAPISVSLVKPTSTDTPLFDKAKTQLGVEPQPVPPVFAPDVVADTILECAQRPVREIFVGGSGKMGATVQTVAPRLFERVLERRGFEAQLTGRSSANRADNLHRPVAYDGGERGLNWWGRVSERSPYTRAALRPGVALAALGIGAAVIAGARALRRNSE